MYKYGLQIGTIYPVKPLHKSHLSFMHILCFCACWIYICHAIRFLPDMTPLKLAVLLQASKHQINTLNCGNDGGALLLASIDHRKSPTIIAQLLSCNGLNFQRHLNKAFELLNEFHSINGLNRFGYEWLEVPVRTNCLEHFMDFRAEDAPYILPRPWLWIDQPIRRQNVSPELFRILFNRSTTSTFLRNSASLCKSLQDPKLRQAVSGQANYWMVADPYCMLANPSIVSSLLISMMRTDVLAIARQESHIDRLVSIFAASLIIIRLNQKESRNVLLSILSIAEIWTLDSRAKMVSKFSRFYSLFSEQLTSLIIETIGGKQSKPFLKSEPFNLRRVESHVLNLWKAAENIDDPEVRQRLKLNLLIIAIELELEPGNIYQPLDWLKPVLSHSTLQERHVCMLLDSIMSKTIKGEIDRHRLLRCISKVVIERNFERPFVCNRHDDIESLYIPALDAGLILRRNFFDLYAHLDLSEELNEKYLLNSFHPRQRFIDSLRSQVMAELKELMDGFFISRDKSTECKPPVIFTLDLHPYRVLEFWYLLGLSNLLRLDLPFNIDPFLARWYSTADRDIGDFVFNKALDEDLQLAMSDEEKSLRLNSISMLWDVNVSWIPTPTRKVYEEYREKISRIGEKEAFKIDLRACNANIYLSIIKGEWIMANPKFFSAMNLQMNCKLKTPMISKCLTSPFYLNL